MGFVLLLRLGDLAVDAVGGLEVNKISRREVHVLHFLLILLRLVSLHVHG